MRTSDFSDYDEALLAGSKQRNWLLVGLMISLAIHGALCGYFYRTSFISNAVPMEPIAQTPSCEAPHFQYHIAGRLAIRMDDGTEFVAEPGDVTSLPSGHDAWVLGDEPVVVVDWFGASNYAKESA